MQQHLLCIWACRFCHSYAAIIFLFNTCNLLLAVMMPFFTAYTAFDIKMRKPVHFKDTMDAVSGLAPTNKVLSCQGLSLVAMGGICCLSMLAKYGQGFVALPSSCMLVSLQGSLLVFLLVKQWVWKSSRGHVPRQVSLGVNVVIIHLSTHCALPKFICVRAACSYYKPRKYGILQALTKL